MNNEVVRPKIDYTQVPNKALRDKKLSLKAKGIYAYIYSKPEHWEFSGDRICLETSDKRYAVYAALDELKNAGYLKISRNSAGKVKYILDLSPHAENQQEDIKPIAENHQVGKSPSGKISNISNTVLDSNTDSPIKTEIQTSFETFWQAYPRKTAKAVALKSWTKLKPSEELLEVILSAIEIQKTTEQWSNDGGLYIPHASTWLNQKRWEDEIEVIKTEPLIFDRK